MPRPKHGLAALLLYLGFAPQQLLLLYDTRARGLMHRSHTALQSQKVLAATSSAAAVLQVLLGAVKTAYDATKEVTLRVAAMVLPRHQVSGQQRNCCSPQDA